eukprot:g4061.t1
MFAPISGLPSARRLTVTTHALFGGGRNREQEKDEMFRRQQEILEERRSKSGKSIKAAEERRRKATAEAREKEEKKRLAREAMSRGEKPVTDGPRKPVYSDEDNELGIVIPIAPFGIPKYDQGERFDLRSPYVDKGWVDLTEKDPFQWVKDIFGGKKKKQTSKEDEENEEANE